MSAGTNQTSDPRNVVEERYFKAKMARPGTFGNRIDWQITTQSPGPGIYNTRDTYAKGGKQKATAVPFSYINRDMPTAPGPGPANYSPQDVEKSTSKFKNAPAYSFKKRPIDNMSTISPGPAQYSVPGYFGGVSKESNKTNHPAIPFSPRDQGPHEKSRAPGPAAYNITDFDVYKNRAPTMKLLSGHGECFATTAGPGPAAYRVKGEFDKLTEIPDFGFGGCHSRPQSGYSHGRLSEEDERSLLASPGKPKTPQKRPPSSGRQQQRPKTRENEETRYYEEAQEPGEKTSGKVGVIEVSANKSAEVKKSTSRGASVKASTSRGASAKKSTSQKSNVSGKSGKGGSVKEPLSVDDLQ